MNLPSRTLAFALLVAAPAWLAGTAGAVPIGGSLSLHDAASPAVQTVQWRGRGWGGRGWGGRGFGWGGAAAGLAAGAIVGGAIAATQPYGYDYGYDYAPGYYGYGYAPGYSYDPGYSSYGYSAGGGDVAYCAQRYRSYDPVSGTYLGYDGLRHPCP
jgi:BA14K-like protein